MTKTISRDDLNNLASKIAAAHLKADKAQLRGETLTAEAPVGYLTGICTVEADIRDEWIDEDDDTVEAAVAESDYVQTRVIAAYVAAR